MPTADRTETIPVYRYTITVLPARATHEFRETEQPPVEVDATGYGEDGPWTTFDDTNGPVFQVRSQFIQSIRRSAEPVCSQEVDAL